MKVKLYQINLKRDTNNCAFMSLKYLMQKEKPPFIIDSSIYDCVFDGEVQANTLEDVFSLFKIDFPKGFKGRSVSVSDVFITNLPGRKETEAYFCDSIGFVCVDFNIKAD